jgi:transcriptional regulator with XRE-family HTH domain
MTNAHAIPLIITQIIEKTGWTQTELAARVGTHQPSVSRWIAGENDPDPNFKAKILEIAREVGVLSSPEETRQSVIKIVGYVGSGQLVSFHDTANELAPAVAEATDSTVALAISGHVMAPAIRDGWLVYYHDLRTPPADELIGKLCAIGLTDGTVTVRDLFPGRDGKWTLQAVNGVALLDQDVVWAQPIIIIRPR